MSVIERRRAGTKTPSAQRLMRVLRAHPTIVVLVVYALCRAVSAIVMTAVAHRQDPLGVPNGPADGHAVSYWDVTRMWDGEWYRRIADSGYPTSVPREPDGTAHQSQLAFYPLFPALTRVVMDLSGASFAVAGSLLSLGLGAGAAVLMFRLLAPRGGTAVAVAAIGIYACAPPSPTLQMAYTESLAVVLLCAFLILLQRQIWWAAGVLGLAIGLARPIGVPVALVAVVALGLRGRERRSRAIGRREALGMATCLVGCGVGAIVWPLLAWAITGERNAYTDTMAAWRVAGVVVPFEPWWRISRALFVGPVGPILLVALIAGMAALILGPWSRRLGPIMLTWCGAYAVYLLASLEPWTSTYRYALLFFPLLVTPLAAVRHRLGQGALAVATGLAMGFNVLAQVYWALHYLQFVPPLGNPP